MKHSVWKNAQHFQKAMLARMGPETLVETTTIGTLPFDEDGLVAIDPTYYDPTASSQSWARARLKWGHARAGRLELTWLKTPEERRVAAAEIFFGDRAGLERIETGERSPVDSATLMIASASRLRRHWRVGGDRSKSNLCPQIPGLPDGDRARDLIDGAVAALKAAGFALTRHERSIAMNVPLWLLPDGLSDAEIARARSTIAPLEGTQIIVYRPHSDALIRDQLDAGDVAVLDGDGEPFGYVFGSGFGDGVYCWDQYLSPDGQVAGYACSFIDR